MLVSSAERDRWVQATKIGGEDPFVCEAPSNEYLDRGDRMTTTGVAGLVALGWNEVAGADFTRFETSETPAQRRAIAEMLLRTLVEVYEHDSSETPRIEFSG